jgi:hypothetical protein
MARYFTREELACKHCGAMDYTNAAVDWIDALRDAYGRPMRVSSGQRCPEYNVEVSSTGLYGPHTRVDDDNVTVDIQVYGAHALELVKAALNFGITGLGVNQKGSYAKRILHLDRLLNHHHSPRPWIWTY